MAVTLDGVKPEPGLMGVQWMRLLLVQEEAQEALAIESSLQPEWQVVVARGEKEAVRILKSTACGVVLLDADACASDCSPLRLCERVRAVSPTTGILVAGAPSAIDDAFDAGADDFVAKPLDPREVGARAKALLRRSSAPPAADGAGDRRYHGVVTLGAGASLDRAIGVVRGPRGTVQLRTAELRLFLHLFERDSRVTSSDSIAVDVFERSDDGAKNLVYRHISNLRAKLSEVGLGELIERRPLGYVLRRG